MSDPFLDALNAKAGPIMDTAGLATAAEQKYNLPAGVLGGLIHVESRGNPNAVSNQGAVGIAQILPSTAKGLGVDPTDPSQAIDGAARYLREGIDKTGTLAGGLQYYHGGPNQNIWGPKTQAYPGLVMAAMGANPEGGDPKADAASDPFLAALNGATQGHEPDPALHPQSPDLQAGGGVPDASPDVRDMGPQGVPPSATGGFRDLGVGAIAGLEAPAITIARGVGWAANKVGATDYAKGLDQRIQDLEQGTRALADNPDSTAYKAGDIGSEIASTLPLSELKLLEALPAGSSLAKALARYGDMAIQGGAAGALLSKGQNVGSNALGGAIAAPIAGAAIGAVAAPALKAFDAVGGNKLVQALKEMRIPAESEAATAEQAAQTIAKGDALPKGATNIERDAAGNVVGYRDADGRLVVNITSGSIPPDALGSRGARSGIEAHDQMTPEVAQAYQQLTAQGVAPADALREADIRAAGASPTAADVTRNPAMMTATKEGAKADTTEGQALNLQQAQNNQALHTTVQGMVGDLGGASAPGEAMQQTAESLKAASDTELEKVREGYTAADREAAGLKAQTDDTNQAAMDEHTRIVDEMRQAYEAKVAEVNAANLAKSQRMYAGGGTGALRDPIPLPDRPVFPPKPTGENAPGYIDMSGVLKMLNSPEMSNPTVDGLKTMAGGVRGLLKSYSRKSNLVNLRQAERLRQAVNDAYDPMGSGINHHVGALKAEIDKALDETQAGPAYKQARAAFKAWADKYENPIGVKNLIRADAKGNLVHDDNWRSVENLIGAKNDKPFVQIVARLKANGDAASIAKLKATIVQDAYEKATGRAAGTAADQMGNSIFSGSQFHNRLNQIGMTKLRALFEPQEIAKLASIGRAGVAINEAVPGTVNTSHTAMAVINALRKAGKAEPSKAGKIIDHALHAALPIGGALLHGAEGTGIGVGVDAARKAAGALYQTHVDARTAQALARHLQALTSPEATRAADAAQAKALADALLRKAAARNAADRIAPLAAALQERNR